MTLWRANDIATLGRNLDIVKDVDIIKDTDTLRIMNVKLDGQKIAAVLEQNAQGSFAKLSGDALNAQKELLNRWLVAIKENDITLTWAVKKPTFETLTASFDLTDIMRAYARYVLDESAAGRVVLTDEERELLDAMGYYAELKSYTTKLDPNKEVMIQSPAELLTAPENDGALDDIFAEMTTVVQSN